MKKFIVIIVGMFFLVGAGYGAAMAACAEPAIGEYTAYPVFQVSTAEPNILLIMDNSGSMEAMAYGDRTGATYDHNNRYYGYFEPYKKYKESSNVFYRDADNGDWDGNFLNWVTMRRVDVLRKVLVGGKATSRTGGGNTTLHGESGANIWKWWYYVDNSGYTPYSGTGLILDFKVSGDNFIVYKYLNATDWNNWDWDDTDTFNIAVKKGEDINGDALSDEAGSFYVDSSGNNNIGGILQRLWSKARFGLEYFKYGTGSLKSGGTIKRKIGSTENQVIIDIENEDPQTWTPLAEAFYVGMKYFMQEDPASGLDYKNDIPIAGPAANDPYNNPGPVACAKSFVLLLTDGASTMDRKIPDFLKDYDGDGNDGTTTVDSGTTNDGRLVYADASGVTFYLNYIEGYAAGTTAYPSGTTPFTNGYIGDFLVLYDINDNQIYYGEIDYVNTSYDDWDGTSGASEIYVSGTTDDAVNFASWDSGITTGNFYWKVVSPASDDETAWGSQHGSDYLDDIALYARTNDLRADLSGDQNLILYTVYAFGNDATARNLLRDASKNGGFVDSNGNNRPDLTSEWDANGDGDPDTYYEASDGYLLETQLIKAINDILQRAAAGTAVSVLATSGEGEGNLVQAYFRPSVTSGTTEVQWVGYLQSLWVDSYGNLREDTDNASGAPYTLDVEGDKIVQYFLDSEDGNTKIRRYDVSAASPYPALASATYETIDLEDLIPLWEAGQLLSERDADDRKIFTYLDKDKDGVVDESTDDPFDDAGEVVRFHTSGVSDIIPYFGVRDDSTWEYLGASYRDRGLNLIEYIRGKDIGFSGTTPMAIRGRRIETDKVWKLGDIVQSTPVTIAKPPDNYHIIYSDESYQNYVSGVSNRETVVYVGANDGTLHAFTSWVYNGTLKQYSKPSAAPGPEKIGDEIWAYIPQNLLPHLKWVPSEDYTHVYYADLKPKIFDAKILPDGTHYTDGDGDDNWGTFLLLGLNEGGKQICSEDWFDQGAGAGTSVYETRTFTPSYSLLDVTDPRNPRVIWDRTYQDLQFTSSVPAVVKVKEKWFAVFGSGPDDYDGTSNQKAKAYVVDLKTGDSYPNASFASGTTDGWLFEAAGNDGFFNSPSSLDKELNFNVDAIYFGETRELPSSAWTGKAYKIVVPWDWSDTTTYEDDPGGTNWKFGSLFDAERPITGSLSLSIDSFDNIWVYFGTGRYISNADKSTTNTEFLFGFKDPFFNSDQASYYHDENLFLELDKSDLFDADDIQVTTGGLVFENSADFDPDGIDCDNGKWADLLCAAREEEGWFRTLETSGERSVTKMTVLGGIIFAPSFIPNVDVCGFGGDSNLYGLYFETGTAFYNPIFEEGYDLLTISGTEHEIVKSSIDLGSGKASALGIHVGQEEGAKAFIQQSTGNVLEADVDPALNIKSGLINWREK